MAMNEHRGVLEVDCRAQFFIDRALIAAGEGIHLEINPPQKAGLVLGPEQPWEAYRVTPTTVLEHDGLCRMWYNAIPLFEGKAGKLACPRCEAENEGRKVVCTECGWPLHDIDSVVHKLFQKCYAESRDGVHWERPELGLVEFQGNRRNNIIHFTGAMCVPAINPPGPPAERFMAVSEYARQLYVCVSPDGINWTRKPNPVLPFSADTSNQLIYDGALGKYVAFLRGFPGRRTTVRCEFDDLNQAPWPYDKSERTPDRTGTIYIEDELETVMDVDELDPDLRGLDVDHMSANLYEEGVYLGFPGLYRGYPGDTDRRGREGHRYFTQANDGVFETQVAVSRDGRQWSRPDRRPYVRYGLYGELDGGFMAVAPGLIRRNDDVFQYYAGNRTTHGILDPGGDRGVGGIFRLVQQKDRFMSISSGQGKGWFCTKVLRHSGRRLQLNIDCGGLGEAFVEIQDAAGRPLPGFSMADSDPIDLNQLSAAVTWRNNPDVSSFQSKAVRLMFSMRRASLYTFQFTQ